MPDSGPARIGVFGSAFNPPHIGHAVLLGEASWRLRLDRIVVVPTGEAYHKPSVPDPGPGVRLALATAAFSGLAGIEVSAAEVERDGPSYTYVTLEEIAEQNPDNEIHLLMGADTAAGFGGWNQPERVLELARVAVVPRPGIDYETVSAAFSPYGVEPAFVEMPTVAVSSSLVRERIGAGVPYRHLVPQDVAGMIEGEGLYVA